MKVFKFGGASVKDATAVRNVADILRKFPDDQILLVISAMGKTTNSLEKVVDSYFYQKEDIEIQLLGVEKFHSDLLSRLFPDSRPKIFTELKNTFRDLKKYLLGKPSGDYDFEYDQIVWFGELFSSMILSAYLKETGMDHGFTDARKVIRTDNTYREGKVQWETTVNLIREKVAPLFGTVDGHRLVITQGFIGSTPDRHNITLGREGSDFTAAIFAYALDASEVVIWKDVPGLLSADPKLFGDTRKLDRISYKEAIELAYYGATIIHPKTIQPLQNKKIPLLVKSFLEPDTEGSLIQQYADTDADIASCILKFNQILISVSPRDFSFIAEENLHELFGIFARHSVKVNVMQNSAISFSVCLDQNEAKIPPLLKELEKDYLVRYNGRLQLITIRHYDQETIDRVVGSKKILLEQKSRATVQLVVVP